MGLEGMVKLKNPDHNSTNDVIAVSRCEFERYKLEIERFRFLFLFRVKFNSIKLNIQNVQYCVRSSTAPHLGHRSLPDIPISEPPTGDTGSYDLYATVGDKVAEKPQGRSRN